jgi:hypothetical protein
MFPSSVFQQSSGAEGSEVSERITRNSFGKFSVILVTDLERRPVARHCHVAGCDGI